MAHAVSGMAASIRAATESETFDLAGQNVSAITHTIRSAFEEPMALSEMIRITFVTGAGKLARQKYDEGAAKAVTSTLRELGFEEDRGASAVFECAGSFKSQHDTNKNLKTVVVFPKIKSGAGSGTCNNTKEKDTFLVEGSPEHSIAVASINVFEGMLKAKCPSWSMKKGCCGALEWLKGLVEGLDAKLMNGTPLEESEQEFYNTVTGLDDKLALAKEKMHHQVEIGDITKFEVETLLDHNAERLETLSKEIKVAKRKKQEQLNGMKTKMEQRKELLESIEPKAPHKLRHETEINKLWKEALPLLKQEEQIKGRLLSVKETQAMARKDEIMDKISELEEASRGWFEDDRTFSARVLTIRAAFTAKLSQLTKGTKGSKSSTITSNTTTTMNKSKFILPGEKGKKNAWGTAPGAKKKKGKGGGGVFAAMMMEDSDSDDGEPDNNHSNESDSEEHEQEQAPATTKPEQKAATGPAPQTSSAGTGKTKANKKKNKKGKNKGGKIEEDMTEDELLASASRANKTKQEESTTVSNPAIDFLRNYIFPMIVGLVTWLLSLVRGKPKQKRR